MELVAQILRDIYMAVLKLLHGHKGRSWNASVLVYDNNTTRVPVVEGCFAIMFTNVGDTTVFVNDMVVFPSATPTTQLGDSRSISGHQLDVYKGTLTLKFKLPIGAAPAVEIVQLFYTDKIEV